MTSPDLAARLRFLDEAAHLLASPAPEISRHLMSRHNSLLLENQIKVTDTQRQGACNACGTIQGKQFRKHVETKGSRKARRARQKIAHKTDSSKETSTVLVYSCEVCSRKTRIARNILEDTSWPLSNAQKTSTIKLATGTTPPAQRVLTAQPEMAAKKSKQNKRDSGLAALLAKQRDKKPESSGFGLDFMDFMKKT